MTRHPRDSPLFPSPPLFDLGFFEQAQPPVGRRGQRAPRQGQAQGLGEEQAPRQDGLSREANLAVRKAGASLPFSLPASPRIARSEEHTSELQSRQYLVCRLL